MTPPTTLARPPQTAQPPAAPARVSRSEAELLTLTRAILSPGPRYLPSLRQQPKRVTRVFSIGPTAMGLLQQTLARGVTLELLRRGGWQTRRTLVNGVVERGNLWQRHPTLPPLQFGRPSFELLAWLRSEDVGAARTLSHDTTPSLADDLLHYFAAAHILHAGGDLHQPAFARSPLCQLAYPDALASEQPLPQLDLRALVHGEGAIIVEALQPELAARWVAMEQAKPEIGQIERMTRIGQAQTHVLTSWFRAIDTESPPRRDLAGFLADAARELLARGPERQCPDHTWWISGLDLRAPLSARQAAFVGAAAFLRALGTLGVWLDEAGLVPHFDEDYEAAQLLLSSWKYLHRAPEPPAPPPARATNQAQLPAAILDRAKLLATQLQSLHSLGPPADVTEPP
ncbi:hypothetical protein DB30_01143 [Enhygromyxa salina]|uniref:FtsH ternary system domain-containing protein n=1 Tax=Enhygromyxa salina TaxID=215803 RepID=A0A0C2CSP6_9BACT|nr:hypothetical protein [Enhygromyxa salina]KIG12655.1 hypothetical protein DB30_01143 [Enhygromyxa salina]